MRKLGTLFALALVILSLSNFALGDSTDDIDNAVAVADLIETGSWGDKEYWQVDSFCGRAKAFNLQSNHPCCELIASDMDAWYDLNGNVFLIEEYCVDDENPYYTVIDGVLFSKDLTILYRYPAMKTGWYYQIPSSVKTIESDAFLGVYYLRELVIPDSVITIADGVVFQEACLETIHFPKSIETVFDIENLSYLPYATRIIVPSQTPIGEMIRQAEENGFFYSFCHILYY